MSDTKKVFVIGGTCGTGKSTIAERLCEILRQEDPTQPGYEFVEGDLLHPIENIKKMTSSIPLTDDDRWGWLEKVSDKGYSKADRFGSCIITCSSLKKKYRDFIRKRYPDCRFIFFILYGTKEEIIKRVVHRESHFMKSEMVDSQFRDLELPQEDEADSIIVNVTGRTPEEVTQEVFHHVKGL